MSNWTIAPEPVTGPEVDAVMREYFIEMGRSVFGRTTTEAELEGVLIEDPHDSLTPPKGEFLVARNRDREFLGCAGVHLLGEDGVTAELKRMYVRPAGRGAGLGRGLLSAAEEAAKRLGAQRIVCETNSQLVDARALYAKSGYVETAPYEGHGKADHWFAKDLV